MKKKVLITWLLLAVAGALHAQELADTLDASRISALREKTRNTTQTGLMHIESKQLTSGIAVFGTPDIIKKLQLLPGVAAGNELMSGLYVHGGDGNDNLFLLDGVPLYNISHFGCSPALTRISSTTWTFTRAVFRPGTAAACRRW